MTDLLILIKIIVSMIGFAGIMVGGVIVYGHYNPYIPVDKQDEPAPLWLRIIWVPVSFICCFGPWMV